MTQNMAFTAYQGKKSDKEEYIKLLRTGRESKAHYVGWHKAFISMLTLLIIG